MVVKPLDFITRGVRGLVQPTDKCRDPEYLRIICGVIFRSQLSNSVHCAEIVVHVLKSTKQTIQHSLADRAETDAELGALADTAKAAADRAGASIDDALDFITKSNKRIAAMETKAAQPARKAA